MGFLSRSTPASPPPVVVRPIVVQPADLPAFSARLDAVLRVLYGPSDAPIRAAICALSESVGGFDPFGKEALRFMSQGGEAIREESKRPWRWFARASELANEQGEYGLAPRVSILTLWWKMTSPKMTMNDFADMRLNPIPGDAEQAIWQATAEAISHLPDDYTVAQTANEVITAAMVRRMVEATTGA